MTFLPALAVTTGCVIGGACWSLAEASPAASTRTAAAISAAAQGDGLQLVVPVEGGLVGWCMIYQTPNRSGAKCPVIPTESRPIVAESWSSEPHPAITEAVALTTGAVSAVSAPGLQSPVATRTEAGLPYGLRAAFLEIPGQQPAGEHRPLTPLASSGATIKGLPASSTPAGYALDARAWRRPAHAPSGPCEISSTPLPGLTAESGRSVLRLQSFSGIIGQPFLACADIEYDLGSSPLDAGVVLDATHPGTAPAALPGMRPLSGHPGSYEALGWAGRLAGRRIRGAWLVVEGGSSAGQRLTLLEHLRASVHA